MAVGFGLQNGCLLSSKVLKPEKKLVMPEISAADCCRGRLKFPSKVRLSAALDLTRLCKIATLLKLEMIAFMFAC